MQNQMQHTEITGSAGNGLVTLVLTGDCEMKSITIKPECVDAEDIEGLQDLIKAAFKDAKGKLESQTKMPGGMPDLSMFGLS